MSRNPYVRDQLPATRNQVCDPACAVESRLAVLSDLNDGWWPHGADQYGYDFLATLTWLERVQPEILAGLDPEGLVDTCRHRLETEGRILAQQAIAVPCPQGWLDEAHALQASYEELIDPVERAGLAFRLINDLDDAELATCAARRAGLRNAPLEEGLERCRSWVDQQADAFLAAGVYVQDVGLALRPDLASIDPALARTAEKFVRMLDALEELEAECEWTDVRPFAPSALEPVLKRYAADRDLIGARVVYPFRGPRIFTASPIRWAAETDTSWQGGETCVWESPEHDFQALLAIFRAPSGDDELLAITFQGQRDRCAVELSGEPVAVGSCQSRIESAGQTVFARFRWAELKKQDELRLFVGGRKVEWSPVATDPFAA